MGQAAAARGFPPPGLNDARRVLVVLDTSVLIDYLRGRPVVRRVDALRRTTDVPATTALNVEEVYRGLRDGVGVDALLRGLRVLVVASRRRALPAIGAAGSRPVA